MDDCPHGFPKRSMCTDCMMDGPVTPPKKKYAGDFRKITALFDGPCAANTEHRICEGDTLIYVEEVGWCCDKCAE